MADVDYEREAGRYASARGVSLAAIAPWREAVLPWLGEVAPPGPILDGGAGAGQFTRGFRVWLDRDVIALEPAHAMRREARAAAAGDARQRWLAGRLEDLPLAGRSCAAAWLSTVVHHVPDLARCARELRRVLVAGAPVLVRSAFPDRDSGITLLRYFPEARRRLARFPSVERVTGAFAAEGFAAVALGEVAQESAPSLSDFRARVVAGRHADSLLASLDDAEFARGMAALDAAVRDAPPAVPVHDSLTLLVLR